MKEEQTVASDGTSPDVLMTRVKQRDLKAFAQLYILMLPAIQRYAASQGFQASAAQDIAHDVFLRLLENPERYDTSRPAEAYVLGISQNVMREHRRETAKAHCALQRMPAATAVPDSAAETERRELAELLASACSALSDAQAAALNAACSDGMKLREAAKQLGCTQGGLRRRLHEARRRMRQLLNAQLAIVPVNVLGLLRRLLPRFGKSGPGTQSLHWCARWIAGLTALCLIIPVLCHRSREHGRPEDGGLTNVKPLPRQGEGAPSPGVNVEWQAMEISTITHFGNSTYVTLKENPRKWRFFHVTKSA